jgi:CRISPR-associated endonuclease/helicase Cas3
LKIFSFANCLIYIRHLSFRYFFNLYVKNSLKANKNQNLSVHLKAVAELSKSIVMNIGLKDNNYFNIKDMSKIAYFSGLLHDIGKIDPGFQNHLSDITTTDGHNGVHLEKKGFSFEDYPRHNEISWLLLEEVFDSKFGGLNKAKIAIVKNIVLWHHAAPLRKEKITSRKIADALIKNKSDFSSNFYKIIKELDLLNVVSDDIDDFFETDDYELMKFKRKYSESSSQSKSIETIVCDIKTESITSMIRSIVITADRLVSKSGENIDIKSLTSEAVSSDKNSDLIKEIQIMEKNFYPDSKVSIRQVKAAKELSEFNGVSVLNAPAGAGKSKTALQWLKNKGQNKLYYIAPRKIICEEFYSELKSKYLPKNVSFELITGDKKIQWINGKEIELSDVDIFRSDIVITTIDQIIKTVTTHSGIDILFDVIKSPVLFDEFHEYYHSSGFDLLFSEIINIKNSMINANTLLMSATPNYFFMEKLLGLYHPKSNLNPIVNFETINTQDFKMIFDYYDETSFLQRDLFPFKTKNSQFSLDFNDLDKSMLAKNPFFRLYNDKQTLVISNTATTAQLSYLINQDKENSLLAHSKFKPEDKIDILKNIKHEFSSLSKDTIRTLRSGPIVQASINITSERIVTDLSNPENILQRLGRLNRFSDEIIGEFIIALPLQAIEDSNVKGRSNVLGLLSKNNEKSSSLLWIKHLKDYLSGGFDNNVVFKLSDIYSVYKDFYQRNDAKDILSIELMSSLHKSYKNIEFNISDPIESPKTKDKKNEKILSKLSLRGQGYYVKMAQYDLGNNGLSLMDDYASNISLSKDDILLYDENFKFVHQTIKHFSLLNPKSSKKTINMINRFKKSKTEKHCRAYMEMSRREGMPINLSLSGDDLNNLNKNINSGDSIVYIKSDKQNIGYIKINKLIDTINI